MLAVDEFGNTLDTVREMADGSTLRRQASYLNDEGRWILGRPTYQRVEHETDRGTESREGTAGYQPETGFPVWTVREPNDAEYRLTMLSSPDRFGNGAGALRLLTRMGTTGEPSRSNDQEGVFPQIAVNGLLQPSFTFYDRALGVPILGIDSNGVTVEASYDGFGRFERSVRRSFLFGPADGAWQYADYSRVIPGAGPSPLRVRNWSLGGEDVTTEYDRLGRPSRVETIGFEGVLNVQNYAYDRRGDLESLTDPFPEGGVPSASTFTEFDELGRIVSVRRDDNRDPMRFAYDGLTAVRHRSQGEPVRCHRRPARARDQDGGRLWEPGCQCDLLRVRPVRQHGARQEGLRRRHQDEPDPVPNGDHAR